MEHPVFQSMPISSCSFTGHHWEESVFSSPIMTWHFPLLNSTRLPFFCFSKSSAVPLNGGRAMCGSAPPPSFGTPAKLLRVQSAPSPQSLMEMLNSSAFTISPWRAALWAALNCTSCCWPESLEPRVHPFFSPPHCSFISSVSCQFVYENLVRDIKSQDKPHKTQDKPQPLLFPHPLSHSSYIPTIRFQMCFWKEIGIREIWGNSDSVLDSELQMKKITWGLHVSRPASCRTELTLIFE